MRLPSMYASSSFRQVPDNQEVFANAHTDQCVIVELLQYEQAVPNTESAKFFFNEIAQSNGCSPNDVTVLHTALATAEEAPVLSGAQAQAAVTSVIVGDQHVAKFKESDSAKNVVRVYLANVR